MNIEQLRYFQLTASFQHMSKAADVLNISQPALGSNIRRLEIELGVPLFDRVGRNIVLNSYGEEFLKSANSIIDIWSEITIKLKSMRDNNSNTVTFRMPSLSNFDALQQIIYEKYPKCILVNDDFYFEELESLLLDRKLDFCITGSAIKSKKITQKKVSTTRNVMLVKSTSPYAAYKQANLVDFKDALFCDLASNRASGISELPQVCNAVGFDADVVFVGACIADLLDAVKFRGLVAWLPEYILKGYRFDGISIVELDEPGCYCSLYMAWCEELLSQKPLAYEIRKIVEEYFVSQVNEYES